MSVDQKSYDLAAHFLADHPHDLPDVQGLAEAIQREIEEWLEDLAERRAVTPACLHATKGVCETCMLSYCEDPEAWADWGLHEQGRKNMQELMREIDEAARNQPALPDNPELPF